VNGALAEIQGETAWKATDEALVQVEVDKNDSHICRVTALGPIGSTQVVALAQSVSGRTLTAQVDVSVISAEATTGTIYMQGITTSMYGPPPPPTMGGMSGGTLR
jgi:hypothetical protein